jgi:hypothetical protein
MSKQSFNTLHGRAQADAATELGGRFREALPTPTVVGASPIAYPRMPANNPWAFDPVPIEPPLGYRVDDLFESLDGKQVAAPSGLSRSNTSGSDAARRDRVALDRGSVALSQKPLRRL